MLTEETNNTKSNLNSSNLIKTNNHKSIKIKTISLIRNLQKVKIVMVIVLFKVVNKHPWISKDHWIQLWKKALTIELMQHNKHQIKEAVMVKEITV